MRKTIIALALTAVGISSVSAEPFVIDPSNITSSTGVNASFGNGSSTLPIDFLNSSVFYPVSFYADASGNGRVDQGEFVFDIGTNIGIGSFDPLSSTTNDSTDFNEGGSVNGWQLSVDYLLYGTANILELPGAQTSNGTYDAFGFEGLGADLTGGLVNLFIEDFNDNRFLLSTYQVNNATIDPGNITVGLDGIYAADNALFQGGVDYNQLIANGGNWSAEFVAYLTETGLDSIPGTYNPNNVDSSLAPWTNPVSGQQITDVNYYGKTASQIINSEYAWGQSNPNPCVTDPSAVGFVTACNDTIPWNPSSQLANEIFGLIGDEAGSAPILARTTRGSATLEQAIPEPSTLALLGFSLIGLFGFARRK